VSASAFVAHRHERFDQLGLVPGHVDDVLAQVSALGIAQPLFGKPYEQPFLPFVEVASRRRLR